MFVMMKAFTYIIMVLTVTTALFSCDGGVDGRLARAESLMDEHYDSALMVLDSIQPSGLRGEADRALYAMLYTEALDKNHLSPTDDSLIAIATDYYETTDDHERQVISNYYRGRVRYINNNYPLAIVSFFKAKDLAEEHELFFWAGMACRGIADIYQQTYNAADELLYAEKEYEFTKKSGRQPYLNYALLDLCRALYNNDELDRAISVSRQLVDSAKKANDPYLNYETLRLWSYCLISQEKYADACHIASDICNGDFAVPYDSLTFCQILASNGEDKRALKLLSDISEKESPFRSATLYEIYKRNRQYDMALVAMEYVDSVTNDVLKHQ